MIHRISIHAVAFVALMATVVATPIGIARGESESDSKTIQSFENKEHGFQLQIPSEWAIVQSASKQTLLQLAEKSATDPGRFRDSIQVRLESSRPLPGVSLEAAAKGLRGSMEKHGFKILEVTDSKLGGLDAKRLVYAHRVKTPEWEADVKAVLYIVMRNDWTYGVDIRSTERTFDTFQPLAKKVTDTFVWNESKAPDSKDK